jgi:hypothetical protein
MLSLMASLHKNGFGFSIHQNFPILNLLLGFQEPMVYIGLNLATNSQLLPNILPQKGLQTPQYWPKSLKTAEKNQ